MIKLLVFADTKIIFYRAHLCEALASPAAEKLLL